MNSQTPRFLEGGGEMGNLIRSIDWSGTPLGPVDTWPLALKIATEIMLSNPFPMYIAWGKEYTQLYNDGYRPILGSTKHPQAMGINTKLTFPEVWHTVGPMFEGVMNGQAVGFPNFMLPLDRNGFVEECYFDFSYSPIRDEEGNVGGVLVTVIETTEQVKSLNKLTQAKNDLQFSKLETEIERDRFKKFFMDAPAGICILDGPDLIYEMINASCQTFFPGRDLIGKPLLKVFPELKDSSILTTIENVYRTGVTFEGKELLIPLSYHEGGRIENRYFNFIYQARLNTAGEVNGIIIHASEVTEMVKARSTIEESEKRFRTMVELSPVAMMVTKGDDMIFETINPPMLKLIGKNRSVIGKPGHEAIPELKGQAIVEKLYDTYRTGTEWKGDEILVQLEREGLISDGYFNISYKPLVENGQITGVLQSAIDVTHQVVSRQQLKEAEENFHLLADNISQLAWMAHADGYIFWYNQRWFDYTGTTHEEMEGWGWQKVHHPDHVENVTSKFKAYVENAEIWEDIFPLKSAEGEFNWFLSRAIPLKDDEGNVIRWFGTNTDINEQRKQEQQKDDFISIASHELKTPVTSLKAALQILNRLKDDPGSKMFPSLIDQANKSMNKVTVLINDLLNVSKMNHNQLHLSKSRFVMAELVNNCCQYIRLENEFKVITHGELALEVYADPERMEQVLTNLISNATKYAPQSKDINISIQQINGTMKVSVTDKGWGIPPEKLPHLFDRYFRVDKSGIQVSGLGLGLYICSEIIKKHNGNIGADSIVGEGSTFWFTLPLDFE